MLSPSKKPAHTRIVYVEGDEQRCEGADGG